MTAKKKRSSSAGAIATNRRARYDYDIESTYEAGIVLVGSEVKSLRAGKASLADAYATIRDGEAFLYNLHIPEYPQASIQNHEPTRARKLLLHARQIDELRVRSEQEGYTLVPLRLYFKDNRAKVEIAVARGRKRFDKRQAIAKREHEREMERARGRARRSAG